MFALILSACFDLASPSNGHPSQAKRAESNGARAERPSETVTLVFLRQVTSGLPGMSYPSDVAGQLYRVGTLSRCRWPTPLLLHAPGLHGIDRRVNRNPPRCGASRYDVVQRGRVRP